MERLTIRSKNSDMVWFKDAENGNAHLEPCEMTAHHNRMALDKLATYEDAGEVSTCRNAVEICRAMIERGIEPDNIKEYITFEDNLVQRGYDLKRLLEMMEQQTAKKAITYRGTNRADCPICGATVRGISKPFGDWCSNCGQKLDWSDEE